MRIAVTGVVNSAGDGRCGYATRGELADAYVGMLTDARHKVSGQK